MTPHLYIVILEFQQYVRIHQCMKYIHERFFTCESRGPFVNKWSLHHGNWLNNSFFGEHRKRGLKKTKWGRLTSEAGLQLTVIVVWWLHWRVWRKSRGGVYDIACLFTIVRNEYNCITARLLLLLLMMMMLLLFSYLLKIGHTGHSDMERACGMISIRILSRLLCIHIPYSVRRHLLPTLPRDELCTNHLLSFYLKVSGTSPRAWINVVYKTRSIPIQLYATKTLFFFLFKPLSSLRALSLIIMPTRTLTPDICAYRP